MCDIENEYECKCECCVSVHEGGGLSLGVFGRNCLSSGDTDMIHLPVNIPRLSFAAGIELLVEKMGRAMVK